MSAAQPPQDAPQSSGAGQPGAPAPGPRAQAPSGSTGAKQGERLFQGTARHSAKLVTYLKWFLVCAVGGVIAYFVRDLDFVVEHGLPTWLLVLVGVPGMVWTYLVVVTTRYTIDGRRVETEEGVISRRVDSLELWRVLDVQYEQSLLDRMTNNAKIRLIGTDQTHPTLLLHGIPGHRDLFNALREAVQTARHSNRPMELVGGAGGEGLESLSEGFGGGQ